MSDNTIRAIIVLLIPVLIVVALAIGIWHAAVMAYDELTEAWRMPQGTAIAKWAVRRK
jgi:hypothetical protein